MPLTLLRISIALATLAWPAMANSTPGFINNLSEDEPEDMLELLSVQAISATGVVLTFSADIIPPGGDPAEMIFRIEDGSGATLRITRIDIIGSTVTFSTDTQVRKKVYRVHVSDSLQGRSPLTGNIILLNGQKSLMFFSGHSTGRVSPLPQEPVTTVALPSTDSTPNLSKTGAGIALIFVAAGGVMGWRKTRT